MFKTNSRKGLGLASIVALVATAFIGIAPAQAASSISLTADSGTTNVAISGETFTLKATINGGGGDDWSELKFRIVNSANATFSYQINQGSAVTSSAGLTRSATVNGVADTTSRNATIAISTTNTSSDHVFTVQAFLDYNGNGVVDAGTEIPSTVGTVTFVALSNITFTTALTPVVLGAGELVATVSTNKNLNLAQLGSALQVGLGTISSSGSISPVSPSTVVAGSEDEFVTGSAVVNDDDDLTAEVELADTILAEKTYVAQALYGNVEVGAAVTSVVGVAPVSAFSPATSSVTANVKDGNVRTGTTELVVTTVASKSSTVLAAVGTVITVEVAETAGSTIATTSSIVGGGKTLVNSTSAVAQKISFDVAVGADGKVSAPLTLNGLKDTNTFIVTFKNGDVSTSVTYTVVDTEPASIIDLNVVGGVVRVATGSTFTLTYGVLDNFGQPFNESDYRVTLTNAASTATLSAAVVAGKVSFSVTDSSTKAESPYTAQLEMLSKASNTYVAVSSVNVTTTVTAGTIPVATAVTVVVSTTSAYALNTGEHFAADTRVGQTAPAKIPATTATLSGQVTAANGLGTYAVVTLAAPGAMFEVAGLYTLGSATVQTDATGAYSGVNVYMQKSGKVSVSATVGTVTKDVAVSFAEAAESTATAIELTVPANVVPGSTVQVKGKLTDKFGNAVKVSSSGLLSVKWVGPGFVTGTLPTTTDKDGEFMFSVLLGSADTGTATITVAYDGDGVATTTANNVVKAATITIGAAAAAASDQKLTVGSFKGFVAIYALNYTGSKLSAKVAGKWLVENNLSRFERVVRLTGAAIPIVVDLYIDGKFVRTENIVTK